MKLSTRSFTILMAVSVGLFGVTLMAINQGWFQSNQKALVSKPVEEEETRSLQPGYVRVGDVDRPAKSLKKPRRADKVKDTGYDFGTTPAIPVDSNETTKKLAESRGNPKLDYRRSSLVPAPKFDRTAYEADPQAYLTEIAPGRINQALSPGKDVTPIKRVGNYFHDGVLPGESVKLKVKTEPKMPTTFKAQLGAFENRLSTITVAANENGIAQVNLKIDGGISGELEVKAVSPVHSDTARWLIEVVAPRTTTQNTSSNK